MKMSAVMPLKTRGGFNVTFVDFEWSRPPCTAFDKLSLAKASLLHRHSQPMCPFDQRLFTPPLSQDYTVTPYLLWSNDVPVNYFWKLKSTSLPVIVAINNKTIIAGTASRAMMYQIRPVKDFIIKTQL